MKTSSIYPLGCTAAAKVVELEVEPLTFGQRMLRIALKPYVYHLCDKFSDQFAELINYVLDYHEMASEIATALNKSYDGRTAIDYATKRTRELASAFWRHNRRRWAIVKYMSLTEDYEQIRFGELLRAIEDWCTSRSTARLVEIVKNMM